jgi:hypothetical protein
MYAFVYSPAALGPQFTQPLTKMATRNRKMLLGSKARSARETDLTAICE